MQFFVMLIGLSASGKSTLAKQYERLHYKIHSSDAIREELFGDESIQGDSNKVFTLLHSRLFADLVKGESVVYDATNLNTKRRAALLKEVGRLAKKHDLHVHKQAKVVLATPETCAFNDARRERSVGDEVILRQLKQFQPPYYTEGWDEIQFVVTDTIDSIKDTRKLVLVTLEAMDHANPHHKGTILSHMERVHNAMEDPLGFYHDIGKYYCRTFDENGIAHYYGHDCASAYLYLLFTIAESYFHGVTFIPQNTLVENAYIISLHMRHYSMTDDKYTTYLNTLPSWIKNKLIALTTADKENP